ncbi:MAG: hypothetical protein JXR96_16450 [Deltaproteobacteria bacterium]|nr:hypothetical protein [Deltaproteobacteria bacterium]
MAFRAHVPVFLTALCLACQQTPDLAPRIDAIVPSAVAADQERFVRLEGFFPPLVGWEASSIEVDSRYTVAVGSSVSDCSVQLDEQHLSFRIPRLQAGCYDLRVTGPAGDEAYWPQGLCAHQAEQRLVFGRVRAPASGRIDLFSRTDGRDEPLMADVLGAYAEAASRLQTVVISVGHRISSDGRWIAFLRPTGGDTAPRDALVLAPMDDLAEQHVLADLPAPPSEAALGEFYKSSITSPVFCPDSSFLFWIEKQQRIFSLRLPSPSEPPPDKEQLFALADPDAVLMALDADIANRHLLYTRFDPGEDETSMWLLPLGAPADPVPLLTHAEGQDVCDGPGSFHPSGQSVIFLSDRHKTEFVTFFGMVPATMLYRYSLGSAQVEPISPPRACYMFGQPILSPDGRLAASVGDLADESRSSFDILITDLATGDAHRPQGDPLGNCAPPYADEVCSRAGQVFPCCTDASDPATCCAGEDLSMCPNLELLPAFGPDSRRLAGSFIRYTWFCKAGENGAPNHWTTGLTALHALVYLGELLNLFEVRWTAGPSDARHSTDLPASTEYPLTTSYWQKLSP